MERPDKTTVGHFEISSELTATADEVWARATTPEGVNHELMPVMRMTMPKAAGDMTVATVPLGKKIGRSWVLLLGVLPFDYDDLTLAERGPGFRFVERSNLGSMRRWEHERTVEPSDAGCTLTDRLTFEPRVILRVIPGGMRVATAIVRTIFRHRHKRLRSYFAR